MTIDMTAIRTCPDTPPHGRAGLASADRPGVRGTRLWQALQRLGQRRAAAQLLELARRQAPTDPHGARELRAAASACLCGHDASHRL